MTVQFQSVIDKFSPHDTVFPFDKSADLRDSIFAAACSLHTASSSIKSSHDSLPQKGLGEIAEDASESRPDTVEGRLASGGDAGDNTSSVIAENTPIWSEKVNESTSADRSHHRSASASTQNSFRSRTTSNTDKPLPAPPGEDRARENIIAGSLPDHKEYDTGPSMDGRFSSNSIRPSTKDLYDAYGYMKKAKVGPRPSNDSVGTSTNLGTRTNDFRPVSTLPAGLRMPSRKAVPIRPTSQQAQSTLPIQPSSPVRLDHPTLANSSEKRTPRQPATVPKGPIHILDRNDSKPINALRTSRMSEPGSPKMTPEKQRLMKALQLRQKQMAAQNSVNGFGTKNTPEELQSTKTEIDESILNAVIDTSVTMEGNEPAPITTMEIVQERARLPEDSPISMPETAEGPSTQASSITDEEESEARKQVESLRPSLLPTSEPHDPYDNFADQSHPYSSSAQEVASTASERDVPAETAVTGSLTDLRQSSTPALSEIYVSGHGAARRESPEPAKCTEDAVTAEEVRGDKQLSPSRSMEVETPKERQIAENGALTHDQRLNLATGFNENKNIQHSERLDDHMMSASMEESQKEDLLQGITYSGEDQKPYYVANTNDQVRAIQNVSKEGSSESLDHQVQGSDVSKSGEALSNSAKPSLMRRSFSRPITIPSGDIDAHQVPLPPIDMDEEVSLDPQETLFREEPSAQQASPTNEYSNAMTPQAGLPLEKSGRSVTTNLTGMEDGPAEPPFRRQGIVNPIKRVSSPDQSDEHFLSDDSFMEELKSATVQEAKPVSVSKSPIKPVFSRSDSEQLLNGNAKGSRSVSTPVDPSLKDEEIFISPRPPTPRSTPRSFSAQQAPRHDPQPSHVLITKKSVVSSSISQRIKALEQLSSRPKSPVSPNLPSNTSTFLGLRTTSLRSSSGTSEYKTSNIGNSRPNTAYPSPSPSPELIKSTPLNQTEKRDDSRPIKSATAAVFRSSRERSPEVRDRQVQERPFQLELQKCPPSAEQTTTGPPLSPLKPPRPRFGRFSSTRSESSSGSEQKLEPPSSTRRDSFASIRSKSSRAGSEVELPRTLSESSLSGTTSLDGTQDEKKDSKRSRLMKHMSSISSMSRRSIANALSPGPKEAPIIERQEPIQEAPPPTLMDIGDVNVQFPDTLVSASFTLWLTSTD